MEDVAILDAAHRLELRQTAVPYQVADQRRPRRQLGFRLLLLQPGPSRSGPAGLLITDEATWARQTKPNSSQP